MSLFGPDERELFETSATALYSAIVTERGIDAADARIAKGSPDRDAFELLLELDLVVLDAPASRYVAVDPATVQSRVVTPMGQEGAQLLAESTSWARAFSTLGHAWRRSPAPTGGPFTEIHGEAILSFVEGVVADAEEELLTAQPQAGRDAPSLAAAAKRDVSALKRGVRMRTLYQHSARRSAITHKYVAAVTAEGAEVRTLDEFFNRIIIIDRRLAVIPGHSSFSIALAVREPNMVAYLVDLFERTWERARPFGNTETSMVRDIAAEQRAMTIRMLIEGHADPVSAKRLGVSPRTYAGYVADLKGEYEAETRFQLGYTMGRMGVSGHEPVGRPRPEPDDASEGAPPDEA